MGLEHIRRCVVSTSTEDDNVCIHGVSKITGEERYVFLTAAEFKAWQDGFPISVACEHLSTADRLFLTKGE